MDPTAPPAFDAAFFGAPRAVLVWGEDGLAVNRLLRALADRFGPEFLHLVIEDPDEALSIDPAFGDVAPDHQLRVQPSELLPDPGAGNLSAFVGARSPSAAPGTSDLLLPPLLRSLLDHREVERTPSVVAITDADRIGQIPPELVRALGEVNRRLREEGLTVLVGHKGLRSPEGTGPSVFDAVLRVHATLAEGRAQHLVTSEPARPGAPAFFAGSVDVDELLVGLRRGPGRV